MNSAYRIRYISNTPNGNKKEGISIVVSIGFKNAEDAFIENKKHLTDRHKIVSIELIGEDVIVDSDIGSSF